VQISTTGNKRSIGAAEVDLAGTTGFEHEPKRPLTKDEADLRTKVESFFPQEIAAFIETREEIIECFAARLRECFRNEQVPAEPELVSEPALAGRVLHAAKGLEQQVHPSELIIIQMVALNPET
jgi:hypothetical protein